MFTVIYKFEVKSKHHKPFEKAWKELTKLIYQYSGSYGSRLHKEKENIYIAYAQWPDKKTWETGFNKLPKEAELISKQMNECCHKTETLHTLEVVEDLLKR